MDVWKNVTFNVGFIGKNKNDKLAAGFNWLQSLQGKNVKLRVSCRFSYIFWGLPLQKQFAQNDQKCHFHKELWPKCSLSNVMSFGHSI